MPAATSAGSPTPPSSHEAAPTESPGAARSARGCPHSHPAPRESGWLGHPDLRRRPRGLLRHHERHRAARRRDRPRGGPAPMSVQLLLGDCRTVLPTLPANSVHCVVTSPPYWGLRDYGVAGQLGLEPTPEAYVARMVAVFREVRRVLRDDGTCWVNMGDGYAAQQCNGFNTHARTGGTNRVTMMQAQSGDLRVHTGLPPKNLVGMPWRLAFALQADGWFLRADCIWAKPNPMPESVTDRPTKAHEYVFLLTKSGRYFYDADAVREAYSEATYWTCPQPDKAARAGQTTNGTGASTLRQAGPAGRN